VLPEDVPPRPDVSGPPKLVVRPGLRLPGQAAGRAPESDPSQAAESDPSASVATLTPASQTDSPTAPSPPASGPAPWAAPGETPHAPKAKGLLVPEVTPVVAEGRSCPQCGTRNPEHALFCWQCYRLFPGPGAQATTFSPASSVGSPVAPGGPPVGSVLRPALDDASEVPSRTLPKGVWLKVVAAAAAAVLLAAAGKVVLDRMGGPHLQVPAAIAGAQRIDDPRFAPAIESLQKFASDKGTTGKAALYGYNGVPAFFFGAFEYGGGPGTADQMFQAFVDGFASTGQSSIDLGTKHTNTVVDTTFTCAKVRGRPTASVCMWLDQDVVGFVAALGQGVDAAQNLTIVVRTSVEG
jgi:hypothetical protein